VYDAGPLSNAQIYLTPQGPRLRRDGSWFNLPAKNFDDLVNHEDLSAFVAAQTSKAEAPQALLAPLENQEVWAAGVTYFRSRTARMDESKDSGHSDLYDKVYNAVRPELFFKATRRRVVNPGQTMHRRSDSRWMVPEPELALLLNRRGEIVGYAAGNDLSCRDIEGENPLYLPQAKIFDRCAAIGPGVTLGRPAPNTGIALEIHRGNSVLFEAKTDISQMKKSLDELVAALFQDQSFPDGAWLFTGTGIVPNDDVSLAAGDRMSIRVDGVDPLENDID
jgi:2-dehydro-3-deoxy-D-arabinonate dehydratase